MYNLVEQHTHNQQVILMHKIFSEYHILSNFRKKTLQRHPCFKPPSNDWKYMYNSFKCIEDRALILLKLIYPDGITNYVLKPDMYRVSIFVPSLNLYIDYHEFISHSGPYNQYRSFDPSNKEDIKFIEEVSRFSKTQRRKYWVSVDRLNTWATTDFEKLRYMKMTNKKYKIFWSIAQIEQCATKEMIYTSKQLIKIKDTTTNIQNAVYYPIDLLYNKIRDINNFSNI